MQQVWRWLNGERRFYRRLLYTAQSYDDFRAAHLPDADTLQHYTAWSETLPEPLSVAIISVVDDVTLIPRMAQSLLAQTYSHWHWYIVTPHSLPACLPSACVTRLAPGGTYVDNLNRALNAGSDALWLLLYAGDTLNAHALHRVAQHFLAQPKSSWCFSDCEIVQADGGLTPFFKPPDPRLTLFNTPVTAGLSVFRRDLFADASVFDSRFGRAAPWAVALRLCRQAVHPVHLPELLYQQHGMRSVAPDDSEAVLLHHADRCHLPNARVRQIRGTPHLCWQPDAPAVSIIIPTKDKVTLLRQCLGGLLQHTHYPNYEIILVDTGSESADTYAFYDSLAGQSRVRRVADTAAPFNYSRACNRGASHADGTHLLFLNNDVMIPPDHPDWLWRAVQWFSLPDVGVVGGKLLYPDGRIQHAGVIVGLSGLADNYRAGTHEYQMTVAGRDDWSQEFLAVTGACLLIDRAVFERAGRFDERYQLNFSDVALCLNAVAAGYRVVYAPLLRLVHHESATHGGRMPLNDVDTAHSDFRHWLQQGDPFYNPNLSYRFLRPVWRQRDTILTATDVLSGRIDI